ncbi:MAG: metallophosphoesterase [Sphingomonadaceae bacterium]
MVEIINRLFRARQPGRLPAVPDGQRVYAIGDIHGRLDLFGALVQAIERDDKARGAADTTVILLGDLIDRGPHSARVINAARSWGEGRKVRYISGNHEEMFLLSFYRRDVLRNFLKWGGKETILSYGITPEAFDEANMHELQDMLLDAVPAEDRKFINEFELMIEIGDYLFVHAGIRPAVPLDEQKQHDCRWIRESFTDFLGDHGRLVVHGHTISDEPDVRSNRIGIDTGAFQSGVLTALCLEGTERWFIQAKEGGQIETFAQAA